MATSRATVLRSSRGRGPRSGLGLSGLGSALGMATGPSPEPGVRNPGLGSCATAMASDPFRRSELGRAGSRVAGDLLAAGDDGLARHRAQAGLVAANAHRRARRAEAVPRLTRDEGLDDAVLQRVKADDHQAAAGAQDADGLREAVGKALQLAVGDDAQRLEDAGCRMDAPAAAGRTLDHLGQLSRGPKRPGGLDGPRHPPRLRLLAVVTEDAGELVDRAAVYDLGCRIAATWIEAHVQRPLLGEGEAA